MIRYDLSRFTARGMIWKLFEVNEALVGNILSSSLLIDRIMETRPGLDRTRIREMLHRIFESEN